jgi:hypothetical protein
MPDRTFDGLLVPASADEAADPAFWREQALILETKLRAVQEIARNAEKAASDALREMHAAARALRGDVDSQPTLSIEQLTGRVAALENAEPPADHAERLDNHELNIQQLQALHGLTPKNPA